MRDRPPFSLVHLSDADLIIGLKSLAARCRETTAELIAHLAEIETRGLHLREGYGSMFVYCRQALALSEHEAYLRTEAARSARSFPAVLEMLAEGTINLTTVKVLAPHLTPENHRHWLDSARGRSKAQVEEMVSALMPFPDVPPTVRKLPPPRTTPAAPPPLPTLRPAAVTPLSPDRYKVQLTISGDTLERLRLAKDMLRHTIPFGDDAAVFDRALGALLADLARKKFAAVSRPQPPRPPAAGSRHIPAEVKRAVFLRDLGRCAFVGTGGRRCNERGFLEFHHVRPYAIGGEATTENVELRCRPHNAYEARVEFGQRPKLEEPDEVEPVPDVPADAVPPTVAPVVVRVETVDTGAKEMAAPASCTRSNAARLLR